MNEAVEKQRKALGKGLSALLPGRGASQGTSAAAAVAASSVAQLPPNTLPIDAIHPNPMQPRVVSSRTVWKSSPRPYGPMGSSNR